MIQAPGTMKQAVWTVMLAAGLAAPAGLIAATPAGINEVARNVERAEAIEHPLNFQDIDLRVVKLKADHFEFGA